MEEKPDITLIIITTLIFIVIFGIIQLALEKFNVEDPFFYIGSYSLISALALLFYKKD